MWKFDHWHTVILPTSNFFHLLDIQSRFSISFARQSQQDAYDGFGQIFNLTEIYSDAFCTEEGVVVGDLFRSDPRDAITAGTVAFRHQQLSPGVSGPAIVHWK